MNDAVADAGILKVNPKTILTWLGVVIPVWGMLTTGILFYQDIMFKSEYDMGQYVKIKDERIYHEKLRKDDAFKNLEARIERTEILVAVFSRNPSSLTESEINTYERAKARLIQLEQQRDLVLGVQ